MGLFPTRTFRKMSGRWRHRAPTMNFAARGSPCRAMDSRPQHVRAAADPWPDESWKAVDTPSYHCPVFVLTHHPRARRDGGGTTFTSSPRTIHASLALCARSVRRRDVGSAAVPRRSGNICRRVSSTRSLAVSPFARQRRTYVGRARPAQAGYRVSEHFQAEGHARRSHQAE